MRLNETHLKIFLYLTAIHSFCVALGLILLPQDLFVELGYNSINENFFRMQGGIFHIVMALAYFWGARDLKRNDSLIKFSYSAKFIATIFLVSYYLLIDQIIVVLLSGIGDFIMAIIIFQLRKMSLLKK